MSRQNKILEYLTDWHGGFWSLYTKDAGSVPERVAENVLCYNEISESRGNVAAYAEAFEELVEAEAIRYLTIDTGLALEVA